MKWSLPIILILFLLLPACVPAPLTLVPIDTVVAETMAAMPKTKTPVPPTFTKVPIPTIDLSTPTPEFNPTIAGAYCIPLNTARTKALVTNVLDGQTIQVASGNQTYKVRYIGLNAPKLSPTIEWRAPQSKSANEGLVNGKYVVLIKDVSDVDEGGTYLRYVIADNVFVNYEMIREGYASMNIIPPDAACGNAFTAAQVEAQAGVRGVWEATPVPTFTITPTPTITLTPTQTKVGICNCSGRRLACADFSSKSQAQSCFNYCLNLGFGDIFGLDKNHNGKVCAGYPF